MVLAGATNWTAIGVSATIASSLLAVLYAAWSARRADRSAGTSRTIELGVKELVDQYREANEELRGEVHECTGHCARLEDEVKGLRRELAAMRSEIGQKDALIDDQQAQIIRLKRVTGEPI